MRLKVLFLCTGNSCRSQMAEGWLRHLAGTRCEVHSAGTQPSGLHPEAVAVMGERGIDISDQASKSLEVFAGQRFDYVITVCDRARDSCPVPPQTGTKLHWSLDDPVAVQGSEDERRRVFRRVRDELGRRIGEFVKEQGLGDLGKRTHDQVGDAL